MRIFYFATLLILGLFSLPQTVFAAPGCDPMDPSNQAKPSLLDMTDTFEPLPANTVAMPEPELNRLINEGRIELRPASPSFVDRVAVSTASDANRPGTQGLILMDLDRQMLKDGEILIAVLRKTEMGIGDGGKAFQSDDYFFVVGEVTQANNAEVAWGSMNLYFASTSVGGNVPVNGCSCANTNSTECGITGGKSRVGPSCIQQGCGLGGAAAYFSDLADLPGGFFVGEDGCEGMPQVFRANGRPSIGLIGADEANARYWGEPQGPPPGFPGSRHCVTCGTIDCMPGMTYNPPDYTIDPGPRDICSGPPRDVPVLCQSSDACFAGGNPGAGDLAGMGICFGAGAGGSIVSSGRGMVPFSTNIPPSCKVETSDICRHAIQGDDYHDAMCSVEGKADRMAGLVAMMRCTGDGSQAAGPWTCCNGVSNCACLGTSTDKICWECSGDSCVQRTEQAIGDPRVLQSADEATTDEAEEQEEQNNTSTMVYEATVICVRLTADSDYCGQNTEPVVEKPVKEISTTIGSNPDKRDGEKKGGGKGAGDIVKKTTLKKGNTTPGDGRKGRKQDKDKTAKKSNDPVILSSGALIINNTDISIAGNIFDLSFERTYLSDSDERGILGSNWTHNWESYLQPIRPSTAPAWAASYCSDFYPHSTCLIYRDGFGNKSLYVWDPITERYAPQAGADSHVVRARNGEYVLTFADGATRIFNTQGYMTDDRDRFGNGFSIELERTPLFAVYQRLCTRLAPNGLGNVHVPSSADLMPKPDAKLCQHLSHIFDDQIMDPMTTLGWNTANGTLPYDVAPEIGAEITSWEVEQNQGIQFHPSTYAQEIYNGERHLLELALQEYGAGPKTGAIRYRPAKVVDDFNRSLDFVYEDSGTNAAGESVHDGLLKRIEMPMGQRLEFTYGNSPDGDEGFLTRVRRVPGNSGQSNIDQSQWVVHANNGNYLEYEYKYDFQALSDESASLAAAYDRYLTYFELIQGCGVFTDIPCHNRGASLLAEGNPCFSAQKAVDYIRSAMVDNIVQMKRSGVVELTNVYDRSWEVDQFDRVLSQTYGESSESEDFLYISSGRIKDDIGAMPSNEKSEAALPSFLKNTYPLERSEWQPTSQTNCLKEGDPPGLFGLEPCRIVFEPWWKFPEELEREPVVDKPRGYCSDDLAFTTDSQQKLACAPDSLESVSKNLPFYKPSFEYFDRANPQTTYSAEPLVRTYLTCGQLAVAETSDPFAGENIGRWGDVLPSGNFGEEWPEGGRHRLEGNAGRICQWTRSTDRRDVETWHGLNYRGQQLVEAINTGANTWQIVEKRYNADGKLIRETDPALLTGNGLNPPGETTYEYDNFHPSDYAGWGSALPAAWAKRNNLLEVRYTPINPATRYDSAGTEVTVTSTFTKYGWEPIFNQLRFVAQGSEFGDSEVIHHAEIRIFDYQEFAPLPTSTTLPVVDLNNDFFPSALGTILPVLRRSLLLGFNWHEDVDVNGLFLRNPLVDLDLDGQTTTGNLINDFYLEGIEFYTNDLNGDQIIGFPVGPNASESERGKGVPVQIVNVNMELPNQPRRVTKLIWSPSGQVTQITDPGGAVTKLEYYKKAQWSGTGYRPTDNDVSMGNIGMLARIQVNQIIDADYDAGFVKPHCENAALPGPYGFVLDDCGASVNSSLSTLGVPQAVIAQIADAGTKYSEQSFAYNAFGGVKQSWGNSAQETTLYSRDIDGRVTQTTAPLGLITYNSWNPQGRLIAESVSDSADWVGETTRSYNASGKVVQECHAQQHGSCGWLANGTSAPAGAKYALTTYGYDPEDNIIVVNSPTGAISTTVYDALQRPIIQTTTDGLQTRRSTRSYDVFGRVILENTGPANALLTTVNYFDSFGKTYRVTDRRGENWYAAWDTRGNPVAQCYDDFGCNPASSLSEQYITYAYNAFDEVISSVVNNEITTFATRRTDGSVVKVERTNEEPEYFAYDAVGNPVWRQKGDTQSFSVWDNLMRRASSVTISGDQTSTSLQIFDLIGRQLESREYGDDGTMNRSTDRSWVGNNEVSTTDPTGRTITRQFDLFGNITLTIEPGDGGNDITQFVNNVVGQPTSLVDPSGQTTTYTYNKFGDLVARAVPGTNTETWEFDEFGRVVKWTPGQDYTRYVYDSVGDLTQEFWGNRPGNTGEILATSKTFDAFGRVSSMTSSNKAVVDAGLATATQASVLREWFYDNLGRVSTDAITVGTSPAFEVSSTWATTSNNRWESIVEYPGTSNHLIHIQEFDGMMRPISHDVAWGAVSSPETTNNVWSGSRLAARTHHFNGAMVLDETATYDTFGARVGWDHFSGSAPIAHSELERDVLGRVRSAKTRYGDVTLPTLWQGIEYDTRHHFTKEHRATAVGLENAASVGTSYGATNSSVASVANSLNATLNERIRETNVGGPLEIIQNGVSVWQATKNGSPGRDTGHRLKGVMVDGATWTVAHDVRGRMTTALNLDLTYDNYNRLAVADTGTIGEYYLYDGTGAMVARGDDQGGFEQFAYDGQHMIGAYDQVGLPKWEATYSAGQDQIIGFHDYVAGKDLIPIRDWRNNVVSAFDVATQTALGHAEYSPEGRITSNVNGAQPCVEEGTGAICALPGGMPFAFNGQWRSDKTGLTYMRNRWYSARLGQFVTTDPLHYVDSVNQYAFVGFDPINAWDPWGLGAEHLTYKDPIEGLGYQTGDQNGDQGSDQSLAGKVVDGAKKLNDGASKIRSGVRDYFDFGNWGLLVRSDTWGLAAKGYKKEVKRRLDNPLSGLAPSAASPLVGDLLSLANDLTRTHDVVASGDLRAIGRLAPELLLKVLAVGIIHKAGTGSGPKVDARFIAEPNGTVVDTLKTPRGSYKQPNGSRTDILQREDHGAGFSHTHEVVKHKHPVTGEEFFGKPNGPGRPVSASEVRNIIDDVAGPAPTKGR